MPITPQIETLPLSAKKAIETSVQRVESKTTLSSDKVKKVIFTSATPLIGGERVENGKATYIGKVNFFICYEDEEGLTKKIETSADFNGEIVSQSILEDSKVTFTAVEEKIEQDASGLYLTVTAVITVRAVIRNPQSLTYLSGADDLICNQKTVRVATTRGERFTAYPIEEEFQLDYPIEQVYFQKATPVITAVNAGVGAIIVDGEVYLSAILLQSGEKSDIIKETKTLSFRAEIECDDAMPACQSVAEVSLKSFKTDIAVDAEKGISQITASVMLNLSGEAFMQEEIGVVSDAFCIDKDIQLIGQEKACLINAKIFSIEENIEGKSTLEELPVGAVLINTFNEKVDIVSVEKTEKGVLVTGACTANGLFIDAEGKPFSRKLETPFEKTLNIPLEQGQDIKISGVAVNSSAKIISLTLAELTVGVIFTAKITESVKITYFEGVEELGEKKKVNFAISVYMAYEGEELFPLAKRLNVNPAELALTNKELNFPLSGDERIVIYRQK